MSRFWDRANTSEIIEALNRSSQMVEIASRDRSPLTAVSVVVANVGLIESEIDNEVVALNIDNGKCYGLNQVGSRVWGMIKAPVRIDEICSQLLSEFKVEPDVCEREVLDLLEELRTEGLVDIREEK